MPVTRRGSVEAGPKGAGARPFYVQIQWRPEGDATEASGFPRDEWADFRAVYMSRLVQQSDERFVSDQPAAVSVATWQCEYLVEMDPDLVDVPKRFRLVYGGRSMDILAAVLIGRQRAIEVVTLAASGVQL